MLSCSRRSSCVRQNKREIVSGLKSRYTDSELNSSILRLLAMKKLRLGPKLIGGFVIVALIAVVIGLKGLGGMAQLQEEQNKMAGTYLPSIQSLLIVSEAQTAVDGAENALLCRALTPEQRQAAHQRIADAFKRADDAVKVYEPLPQSADEKVVWDKFVPAWDKWKADDAAYIQLVKSWESTKSDKAFDKMVTAAIDTNGKSFGEAESLLNEVVEINNKNVSAADKACDVAAGSTRAMVIAFTIVGFILAVGFGVFLTRSITKPTTLMVEAAQKIAVGDVEQNIDHQSGDELGQLANAFRTMVDYVKGMASAADSISQGDTSVNVVPKSDRDVLSKSFVQVVETLRGLVTEAGMLSKAAVEGKLDTRGDASKYQGGYKEIVQGVNDCLDAVIGPLNVAAEYVERISNGDIPAKITDNYNGDFNEIKNNLNKCIEAVNALVADAALLSEAAVMGKLDTRADASKHGGDFAKIVSGVNDCLDSVIGPLNVAAEYVERISNGDIPAPITDNYNGDFNEIKNNLNKCIGAVNALVADAGMLSRAAVEGKLDTRADASKHGGDFAKIVTGVNDCLDSVIGPLNVAAEYVERISNGDIPAPISDNYNGDFNEIKNNLNKCIGAVNALVADAGMLSKAAVEGKLDTRADASKHGGDFGKIVTGVNDCLDSVIGPLNVAAEYVERISNGDIPAPITDNYNGDFNEIKNNLNKCIGAVNALVADAGKLSIAAVEGKLDTRADASKHGGDFAKIVSGVNDCLDSVIGPLNVAAEYVERISNGDIPAPISDNYNGDFNEIKNNLNKCIGAVNALVADANMLSVAAVEGRLATRADASKHGGDFGKIVQGVNDCLDAVIGPVNEAAAALEKVAMRDLTARMMGDYKGDLAKIKNSLNTAVQNLHDGLSQVAVGSEQVASASGQIASSSQSLAQGASEQASSLQEVSSSIQEMASMTKQNTSNAEEARGMADGAKSGAETGVNSMRRMSEAIDKIKASSDETAKIVKTIDEIAFQTNLLALNAAVEAARAGDAGKGFAVVAEEVRNLAMRSAEAAKNTANLIEGSVKNAEEGVAVNQEVMKNLQDINAQVNKVSEVMSEIAAASNEQTQGIEQINQAVGQMDQVTQQNAATSEESASAAQELTSQAAEMKRMVGDFKLDGNGHSSYGAQSGGSMRPSSAQSNDHALPAPKAKAKGKASSGAGTKPSSIIPLDDDTDTLSNF